jgi:hypothetical protein
VAIGLAVAAIALAVFLIKGQWFRDHVPLSLPAEACQPVS